MGTLILEEVLIVPNLDRRLFPVHAFLSKGHNWVYFSQTEIQLGIKNGPSINLPVTSLQSNAFVVDHKKLSYNVSTKPNIIQKGKDKHRYIT